MQNLPCEIYHAKIAAIKKPRYFNMSEKSELVGLSLARAGVVAGIYFTLTTALSPISFGFIQFRLSECLCVLPMIFPETAVGLTVGCFLSNILYSTPLDALFGTIATAISSLLTFAAAMFIKKRKLSFFLGCLSPTIFNGLLVPIAFLIETFSWEAYFAAAVNIALCEAASVYVFGGVLYYLIERYIKKHTVK